MKDKLYAELGKGLVDQIAKALGLDLDKLDASGDSSIRAVHGKMKQLGTESVQKAIAALKGQPQAQAQPQNEGSDVEGGLTLAMTNAVAATKESAAAQGRMLAQAGATSMAIAYMDELTECVQAFGQSVSAVPEAMGRIAAQGGYHGLGKSQTGKKMAGSFSLFPSVQASLPESRE
jgi:hypothetical protein